MKKFILNSGSTWLADLAILIILGLTPLFFNYFYPTSIDLSKIVLFRVFTLLLLFAVIWNLAKYKLAFVKSTWKSLIPFGLLFVFLISSLFFSVDIATSWFGSYDRGEGLVSWLFYGLWATLLIIHLNSEVSDKKIIKINYFLQISVVSGLLVSLYAIFQILGWDFITWSEPASLTGRAVSSFGQPNYLACWLVIVLPFCAYLIYIAKNKISRFIWSGVFLIQLLALLATGSRATFFIFLIVSIFWLIWFLAVKKILSRKKLFLITGSGLIILAIFLSFLAVSNPTRFSEFTDLKKGSAAVRLDLWQTGLEAVTKKPLLGYGLENQKEIYVTYYKIDFALYARPNTYSDRAHNLILDILLTTGIIGLIIFIYFIYWVLANLYKAFKNGPYSNLAAFLILAITTYLISLLFNFSVTTTNIYFWLIVALSFVVTDKKVFTVKDEESNFDLTRIILVLGVAIIFLYGSFLEIRKIEADFYYNKALTEISTSEYFTALVYKDYIDVLNPNKVYLAYYNRGLSLRFLESLPRISDKSVVFIISHYLSEIEKNMTGNNFENKFVKAFILGETGKRYESGQIFNELSLLSPQMPKIYLAWGDSLMFGHDYKNAMIKFEQAASLLPDLNSPYLNSDQKNHLAIYKEQVQSRITQIKLLLK